MDIKDNTAKVLATVYKSRGIAALIKESDLILKQAEHGSDLRSEKGIIKGEVAEVVLYYILKEFQKCVKFKTHVEKGLFIQDSKTGQVTELDLVLITPYKVFIFESKSYSGRNKELLGKCELYRAGEKIADVYEQNKLHTLTFNREYGMFTHQEKKPYTMVLFDFASNLFVDKREDLYKKSIPVVCKENVIAKLISILKKYPEVRVDVKGIVRKLNIDRANKEYLRAEHKRQLGY